MKTKKVTRHLFFGICSFLLFSCNVSEIVKKKYRPGFYVVHNGGKNTVVPAQKKPEKNIFHKREVETEKTSTNRKEADSIIPQLYVVLGEKEVVANKKNIVLSSKERKAEQRKEEKNHTSFQYSSKSSRRSASIPPPKIIWQFKVAIICFLICLLGVLSIFVYSLLPALNFMVYIASIFPETWLTGIIFSITGFFKYRRNPENIPAESKRLDFFSRLALILGITALIDVPVIVVSTFLILYSFNPIIFSVILMVVLSLLAFILGIVGLIKTLKDPMQSRKNIVKAILISIFTLAPICLMIAWFIAVGAALNAALPFLAILLMHGG